MWRSLVARFVRDEEVAGSNPVTPTNTPEGSHIVRPFCRLNPSALSAEHRSLRYCAFLCSPLRGCAATSAELPEMAGISALLAAFLGNSRMRTVTPGDQPSAIMARMRASNSTGSFRSSALSSITRNPRLRAWIAASYPLATAPSSCGGSPPDIRGRPVPSGGSGPFRPRTRRMHRKQHGSPEADRSPRA